MAFLAPAHIAGGNINPCRFVKWSTSEDRTLLEADANEQVAGISTDAQKAAPTDGASTLAAADGDPIAFTPINFPDAVLLDIGSGGCAAGDELKSDADGKGVVRATTGTTIQWVGAIAITAASADGRAWVLPVRYPVRPALV